MAGSVPEGAPRFKGCEPGGIVGPQIAPRFPRHKPLRRHRHACFSEIRGPGFRT
jgi:hypothetical protein